MKGVGLIEVLTRRRFLGNVALLPALTCVFREPLPAEKATRKPPYLALAQYILPGSDEYKEEGLAAAQKSALRSAFSSGLLPLREGAKGHSPQARAYRKIAADLEEAVFDTSAVDIAHGWREWKASLGQVTRFEVYVLPSQTVRYEVTSRSGDAVTYRVGSWRIVWQDSAIAEFAPIQEHSVAAERPWFRDVTAHAFESQADLREQLSKGVPYWRARLDPASGIDIYGSNGIALGDADGDGLDEVYICQPGGLPNRLLKIHKDGRAEDVSASWGVDLLDDTSCALFVDLRNSGKQDLVVLRSSGPLLFVNEGGRYRLRTDAFQFAKLPQGGFTGMAAADFDRDGKLDLYLCCYVYFQSEAQYTYAAPYHDAENGPPNFLFRNRLEADGSGFLMDCTAETGLNQHNNRFSFAPAWCDFNDDGWPDLYVANDFGRKNLYQNSNGHFSDVAGEAGVEDIGPGMSASWFDYDGDGRADLYVANMWTEAGQRVVADKKFKPAQEAPAAYRAHTMGNSLFRNRGNGTFEDVSAAEHVAFGRWAWSSGGHDLDNDGYPEVFVTCGMLTNTSGTDLGSFFWRQVVANSPTTASRSIAYENGWNAINQFIREDYSWNGHEPNVLHARRGDRYFDFSGVSGLDYVNDSRAFAVGDFDGDGRPDIFLKSRLGPQFRILQNDCSGANHSIGFELRGTKSNRDAIGAKLEVHGQTKWLEAGSGFLSQHSKRLLFGLGAASSVPLSARVTWPSGLVQSFSDLKAGYIYSVVEGSASMKSKLFQTHPNIPAAAIPGNNSLQSHDTWFLAPVPLPNLQEGPGLFVVKDNDENYEIFRRYLFDWRAPLDRPFGLLLNQNGEAVKFYAAVPASSQVATDLKILDPSKSSLPFGGFSVKAFKRDYFKFGAAYLWAGRPREALPYLERVLKQDPENGRVLILVGQIHLEQGNATAAAQAFQQAVNSDPGAVNAWIGLGDVAAKAGQQSQAGEYYAKALALDKTSPEAANGLGLALAKQGQLSAAQKQFEQAIKERRDYADAINNLAVLFAQQGKLNDGIAAWQYGIEVAPDEDILYLNLGRAYTGLGWNDKARMTMQKLLDRDPTNQTARRALQELSGR